jgi:TRAP-type transport system periplasmic protein
MKIKKIVSGAIFFLFGIGGILSTTPSYAKETLRLAATTHPDHVFTQTAYRFSQALAKKTKGEIEVKVYPNRELGNEREQMEMVDRDDCLRLTPGGIGE